MKINWLWDSQLSEAEARKILKDESHPKFDIYVEKLLSRVSNPKTIFKIVDEATFCRKWPSIKKRMKKDQWLASKVVFWQIIYERLHERLRERGIKIRKIQKTKIPPERAKLALQIKNTRMKLGYTQKDMAKKLGVIQQYISKVESGRENVSVDTLKRIADVFGKGLVIKLV